MEDGSTGQIQSQERFEDVIDRHQRYWTKEIETLNAGLKTLPDLQNLMCGLYSQRQRCLEYYYNLLTVIANMAKEYKKNYQTRYNYYKTSANIRYSTETAISAQIAGDLADEKYKIECYENYAKFMGDTLKTIDNIIYAVSSRIEIEKIIVGK